MPWLATTGGTESLPREETHEDVYILVQSAFSMYVYDYKGYSQLKSTHQVYIIIYKFGLN